MAILEFLWGLYWNFFDGYTGSFLSIVQNRNDYSRKTRSTMWKRYDRRGRKRPFEWLLTNELLVVDLVLLLLFDPDNGRPRGQGSVRRYKRVFLSATIASIHPNLWSTVICRHSQMLFLYVQVLWGRLAGIERHLQETTKFHRWLRWCDGEWRLRSAIDRMSDNLRSNVGGFECCRYSNSR